MKTTGTSRELFLTLENAHVYTHTRTYIYLNKLTVVRRQPIVCVCVFVFLEVINKGTMQSNYRHDHTANTANTDHFHVDDKNFSLSNMMNSNDVEKVDEREHHDEGKNIEIRTDNDNKSDSLLISVVMPDDSASFSFYNEPHYREMQSYQHANSHDSLIQPDHREMNNMSRTASSTDDLSVTHQLSSSAFHSKDSALGLSDDNITCPQTNPIIIKDDDDDADHNHNNQQQQQQQQVSSLSATLHSKSKYRIYAHLIVCF